MWGYEDSPYESDLYMVDGDKNAFKALSRAMALLATMRCSMIRRS